MDLMCGLSSRGKRIEGARAKARVKSRSTIPNPNLTLNLNLNPSRKPRHHRVRVEGMGAPASYALFRGTWVDVLVQQTNGLTLEV